MSQRTLILTDEEQLVTITFYCYNAMKSFGGPMTYIFSLKLVHKSYLKCTKSKSNSFDLRIAAAGSR